MKYGLIGEKLSHSFSKEIHNLLCDYEYGLCELKADELERFFTERDFCGINVTIPYKTSVMEYLDYIDEAAQKIGAVNTVVNRGGRLYGYNTDAYGLSALIAKSGVDLRGKKVLISGSGGTSRTALYVAQKSGASSVLRLSRAKKEDCITYGEAILRHSDADIIINTTPAGMYPNTGDSPVDLSYFKETEAVFDVIYNPLKTRLVLAAQSRKTAAYGGLYMLVMQAYCSAELFCGGQIDVGRAEEVYEKLLRDKQNIVLIGMPSAGKTQIGKLLSETLDMPFFDSDEEIKKSTGKTPAEIINADGEAAFRQTESGIIHTLSLKNHCVIATGGGAVLKEENVLNLKANGRIYYVDRPLDLLIATPDRPLSSSKEALAELYNQRKHLYKTAADKTVVNDSDIRAAAEIIRKDFLL